MTDDDLRSGSPGNDTPPPLARLNAEWILARLAYQRAGSPFGDSVRGLELWIEYGRRATVN